MNLNVLHNNLVLIYGENIASSLKTDPIEILISEIFSSKTPKPVVVKMADQVNIFVPELQMSISVSGKTMMISDQTIGDFSKKDTKNFMSLVNRINERISKSIIAYGYNFTYELENESFTHLKKKLEDKFCKQSLDGEMPEDSTFYYLLPQLSFKKGDSQITMKFQSVVGNPRNEETNKLRVDTNVHYNKESLPCLSDLQTGYIEIEKYVSGYIYLIFKDDK